MSGAFLGLWLGLAVALSGCVLEPVLCAPCEGACPSGLSCVSGRCTSPRARCGGGEPGADAAELDAEPDAGHLDASVDAEVDAQIDAGPPPACVRPAVTVEKLWDGAQQPGPVGLTGAAAAAFSLDGRPFVALHGGSRGNDLTDQVWLFDLEARRWTEVDHPGDERASGHGLMAVPGTNPPVLWRLGGGCIDTDPAQHSMRALEVTSANSARWLGPVETRGFGLPHEHCGFATAIDGRGGAWLWGGGPQRPLNAELPFYWLDSAAMKLEAYGPASPEPQPRATIRAAAAFDGARKQLYVVGGGNPPAWDPEARFWRYDVAERRWTVLPGDAAGGPSPRTDAVAAWLPAVGVLLHFGGTDYASSENQLLRVYEPTAGQWTAFAPSGGPWPAARWLASIAALGDGRSAFIFGGSGGANSGFANRADAWRVSVRCE